MAAAIDIVLLLSIKEMRKFILHDGNGDVTAIISLRGAQSESDRISGIKRNIMYSIHRRREKLPKIDEVYK